MTTARMAALVAVAVLTTTSVAGADSVPGEDEALYKCKDHDAKQELTFKPEIELKELVTWVMGFTCKNFVYEPRIVASGRKVNLIIPGKMTAPEAYRAFLVALSTMGLAVVPKGNLVRIVEMATIKGQALPIYGVNAPPDDDQIVRYVVRPRFAAPELLRQGLAALKSDGGDVQAIGSLLVITDYASNVQAMLSLAKLIDVPGGSDGIYTIPVLHADATKLAGEITGIMGLSPTATATATAITTGRPTPGGAPTPVATGPTDGQSSQLAPSKLMIDTRTNTLIVAGSDAAYQRVKALAERLDIALEIDGGATIHVYQLGSAIAEEVAKTLNEAITRSGASASPGAAPGGAPTATSMTAASASNATGNLALEGQAKIIADAGSNKLIVSSTGRDFVAIRDVIRELDQPRRQVYIEAMIVEVDVTKDLELGTAMHGALPTKDGNSLLLGGLQSSQLSTLNLGTLTSATGLIGGILGKQLASSSSFLGTSATSIASYGVIFQALNNTSNTNILSMPSFVAVDNQKAKFQVGTNIPYIRGTVPVSAGNTAITTTNIDRKDLLLSLEITPHISTNDTVLLEIKHESSDLASSDGTLGPTWDQRTIETRTVVRDQQTIVIGGLMQQKEIETVTKIPLLGDIPVLGRVFSYTSKNKTKSNLLVLLTPYIVKDQFELDAIRDRKTREHDELVSSFHVLSGMKYEPNIDYRRKRGLVEEINRSVEAVDDEIAQRAALGTAKTVDTGLVDPTAPPFGGADGAGQARTVVPATVR